MMRDYSDIVNKAKKKKREEEETKSSSSSNFYDATSVVEKTQLGKRINFETLESDLFDLGTTIGNIYGGWQTQETMANTRSAIESMNQRLGYYQTYQSKYGGTDMTEVANGYKSVLDDWDNLSSAYGYYQNADAFNKARTKAVLDKQFGGLSYDEVQKRLGQYKEGSDEYEYLKKYTNYSDLKDFDKAIDAVKNSKNALFNANQLKDFDEQMTAKANLPKKGERVVNPLMEQKVAEFSSGKEVSKPAMNPTIYGKIDEDYLNELETARNVHALDHRFDLYKDYLDAEDFDEMSQYKNTAKRDGVWAAIGMNGEDETYEYINDVDGARQRIIGKYKDSNDPIDLETRGFEYMTDEEKAVYNYKYRKEGKKSADAFLKDLEVSLSKRLYGESTEKWEEWSDDGFWQSAGLTAATPILNIAGSIGSAIDTVGEFVKGEEYNPYSALRMASNATSDIRQYVGENIAEETEGMEIFGQNIPQFLYQTGMSVADTAVGSQMFGAGFSAVMGMSSAQQRAKELKEAGASSEEIARGAVASGVFEMVFEKLSLDNLIKVKGADSIGKIVTETLKQAGIEASEEIATEVSNILFDTISRGKNSDAYKMYEELLERGFSKSEAGWKLAAELGGQVAWAGIGGALSGTAIGNVSSASDYVQNRRAGNQIIANDRVAEMFDTSKLTPEESEAYKLYDEYAKKGVNAESANNVQVGNLYRQTQSEAVQTLNSRKSTAEQKADAVKTLDNLNTVETSKPEEERARQQRVKDLAKSETTMVNGETAKIEGIKVEDGVTTLLTSRGEAKAEDMTFSTNDAEIVSHAEIMGNDKGNLFWSQYDGKADVVDYVDSFNTAYNYGRLGFDPETALKNRGVLTEAQASEIYKSAIRIEADARQKAIDDINTKYSGGVTVAGKFDDSIIDYDNGTADNSRVNWSDLSSAQRNAITFAKGFSKATGVNIKFIKSKVVDGKHVGKNGSYNADTNTIEIDVYAGRMDAKVIEDSIIPTLSHEMTHWMKAKSPAMYAKMRAHIGETLALEGTSLEARIDAEIARMASQHPNMEVTAEMAVDEIVARACEDMLSNSEKARELLSGLSESEQKSFIDKVKETFQNLMKWVNDLLSQYKSTSKEAEILRQYEDRLKELSKMWDKALEESIKANQSLQKEGKTAEAVIGQSLVNGISKDGTTIVGENALQMSERTYAEGGKTYLENWLKKKVKSKFISQKDADDIIAQTEAMYQIMQDIKANNELPDYARWAETDITKDENGKKVSVIVKNGDYAMNLDIALVCKKRTALNAVLNALVQSNDLSVYTLTETDVAELNAIIKKHEFEIACALCFVDSKRYRVGSWADSFCEGSETKEGKKYGFNEMVRSLVPKGSDIQIDEFNFTGRNIVNQPTENLLKDADDSQLDFSLIDQIMRDNPPAANGAKSAQYRYAEAIKNNKDLRSILNPSEIISSIGLDAIRVEHTALYGLINGHQGTAKPKFAHQSVAFMNDILRASSWNANKARMVGGVRLQSFSDFMANMVFDYVQMVSEMAAKKLPAHAYTKEPLFVKLFGLTGIKINMSLVPKVDLTPEQIARFKSMTDAQKEADPEYKRLKETAGLRINAKGEAEYVWEDETFPYDVAMDIMADKRYTKNCGTICVGISDAHIRKLLADERISMVIPYHKSGLNHMVAEMRNIALYNDYTNVQNTRYASGEKLDTKKHKDFDFYGDLYGTKTKPGTHDPKQTAQNYLDWCADPKRNYLPKFDEFKGDPNYYKLLIDFSVYDINDNMKYTEQEAVKAVYPSEAEFKDLILNGVQKNGVTYGGLKQAQGESTRLTKETQQIVDEFRVALKDKYGKDVLGAQYSDRYAPTFYSHMDKVIGDIKQNKLSADGVVNYLKGKGVKDEEIKWSGIETFLEGKKSVTKEELKEFSAGSMLQIEDNFRGMSAAENLDKKLIKYIGFSLDDFLDDYSLTDFDALNFMYNEISPYWHDGTITEEQFQELQELADQVQNNGIKWKEYTLEAGSNYRELLFKMPNSDYSNYAMRMHWGQKGVLAHARIQDMMTDDGNRMLFVEEIQSDWHNEGQKKGYLKGDTQILKDKIDKLRDRKKILGDRQSDLTSEVFAVEEAIADKVVLYPRWVIYGSLANRESEYGISSEVAESIRRLATDEEIDIIRQSEKLRVDMDNINNELHDLEESLYGGIPDAPFRNNYHEYVMKRLLRMAAEENYDSIGWTTSEQQIERWSKEYAEGYRIEYDQDIPKFMNKYGKKWGGKVDKTTLENGEVVWNFSIPQSMKDSVLYEGQVMYSDRDSDGNQLTEAQQEFFKDSKVRDADGNLMVMYHGSPFKFTTFEDRAPINGRVSGDGFYFTENKKEASYWGKDGNLYKCYLNITNPLVVSTSEPTPDAVIEVLKKRMGELYDKLSAEPKWWGNKYTREEFVDNEASHYMNTDKAFTWLEDTTETLKALGYDGVIVMNESKSIARKGLRYTEVVAFYPNQIKKTTNKKPTENADIRYSDRITKAEANRLAREKVATYKEQIERKAKIESITQKALVLNKWMLKNSKDEHIPEAMKPTIAHLIQAIDFSSKRLLNGGNPTKADVSLSQALAEVQKMVSKAEVDGDILFELYGADMMAEMEVLVEAVNLYMRNYGDNEYVLNQMNLEQLKTLDKLVSTIKTSVSQMNQFHVVNSKKGVAHAGQQTMRHCEEVGQAKIHKNKFLNNVDKMLLWGNRTPYYAFRQFGESGQLVFEALQDGWDKFAFHIRKIKDYAENVYTEEQVKKWSDEVKTFDGIGTEIQMTVPQIMSLYCLQKREQAKGHILGGGIRVTDIKAKKGVISQSDGAIISETLLKQIIGSLTKEQIAVADALQKFMNEDCTVWGNEISMKRFGYKAFGEENYFPIRSDENVTGTDEVTEKEKTLYRLLNLSFTKSLTQNANNRIVVDNIFDVFAQHTSEMAKYNALALPVLDAVRWFNYKEKGEKEGTQFKTYSVKASIEKAFGKDAKSYLNTFLQDINGAENVSRDSLGSGFMTNAKIASVGLNAKVVALQPTSYLRASAVIDNKYLVKGMAHKPKYKMAEKWCGMAQWKALGFIDINVQRGVADLIKHDESFKDKASEFAMKGAELADQMTMGYLWNACEAEIRDKRKDLNVGTDEYYTAVGKRLREIIYATQVVDSTMTRSQMMRSPDGKDKFLTNFASEPTLSYNMLLDVYSDYKLTERKSGKKAAFNKCGKKFARAMYAYTITNALTALLELGFEIFRDDEEKDSEEVMKMYLENLALNQSIINKIPYAKEMVSLLQGFSSSRMDTQWMQYFAYTIKGFGKLLEGEGNAYTTLKNGIKATSYLSGIPFYNAWRDVNATLNKFNVLTLEEQEEMFNDTIGEMFPSLRIK
jgi:hypothetical protein